MGDVEMTVESPENKDQARGGEESGGGVAGEGRHCLARSKTVPDQSTWSGEWTRQIMRQRLGNWFIIKRVAVYKFIFLWVHSVQIQHLTCTMGVLVSHEYQRI